LLSHAATTAIAIRAGTTTGGVIHSIATARIRFDILISKKTRPSPGFLVPATDLFLLLIGLRFVLLDAALLLLLLPRLLVALRGGGGGLLRGLIGIVHEKIFL
jgi:hypothetical protein